jgi:hypothetical protein
VELIGEYWVADQLGAYQEKCPVVLIPIGLLPAPKAGLARIRKVQRIIRKLFIRQRISPDMSIHVQTTTKVVKVEWVKDNSEVLVNAGMDLDIFGL